MGYLVSDHSGYDQHEGVGYAQIFANLKSQAFSLHLIFMF